MKNTITGLLITAGILMIMLTSAAASGSGNKKAQGKGLDINNIDKSVSPATDFYTYAVGNWIKSNPIPAEYSRWGTFEQLTEENYKVLRSIMEDAARQGKNAKDPLIRKVGLFYSTGMDTAKIEKQRLQPLEGMLKDINSISKEEDLFRVVAQMHSTGSNPLFFFFASPDAKNSSMVIGQLYQAGLGLPDRDYYLNNDERSREIRDKYTAHISTMLKLLGEDLLTADREAALIMDIETRLAKASMSQVELRDPQKTYNKMSVQKLAELAPGFDWKNYYSSLGVKTPGDINVGQPAFFKEVGAMIREIGVENWKPYLRWHLINGAADFLSSDFSTQNFEFYGKYMNGLQQQQPRWKRVLQATSGMMGEAVGQLYVKETFPPEAKQRALKIVQNLLEAMGGRIKSVDWMSETTKQEALKKLSSFTVKIGYPDRWKDYTSLEIKDDSYAQNAMRAGLFEFRRNINKIGRPVEKHEWEMSPQTVNAYYEPTKNEIVFPAAILQPPFFDINADDAVNYGAMGAVIGHEITHGFDDMGRQYDAKGNMRDWWQPEDGKKFDERARLIIEQYNNYNPVDTFHINGALTQGENIADLGGLSVAFTAFKKTDQYKNKEMIAGYTPEQRFFLSWAQVWRNNIRDQNLLIRLKTDPHSPGKYRVIGPLSNMPEFHSAFGVKPGDPMAQAGEKLVKIW